MEKLIKESLELIDILNEYKLDNYLDSKIKKLKGNMDIILKVESEENRFELEKDKIVSSIIDFGDNLKNIEKLVHEANKEIALCDNAINDLLHAVEFIDCSDKKLVEYSNRIKEFRIRRRNAKNFLDVTSSFKKFKCSDTNKGAVSRLFNLKSSVKERDNLVSKRTYTVRVLKGLQKDFDKNSLIKAIDNLK